MPSLQSSGSKAGVARNRTLALVGPAAAGKTSLAEALLAQCGEIAARGSLERGTTVSDHDPLERRMQHSLISSVMHMEHGDALIHLVDTPGGPDFVGQSLPALEAVETAAIVINAVTGIEPMAIRMMDYALARRLDRVIIINKIDAPGVDLPALLLSIQATFGKECLPLNLPDAQGRQVVDCFFNREGHSDFGAVDLAHRALVEQVVEVDAAFVDRYLNDGDVDAKDLHGPLEQALREGHLIPVCFVSARNSVGIVELLDVIAKLLPNPTEGNPPDFLNGEGQDALALHAQPDPGKHVLAHVFKVSVDPYVGKLGVLRVHQGTITKDSQLYVGSSRKPFKVGHLFRLQGANHIEIAQAIPGDICAIAKVEELHFDAVLHDAAEDDHIHLLPLDFPVPVHGLAISPKRRGDEQRMWEVMSKLVSEDPCLKLAHVGNTNETIVYGLGDLHLRMLMDRLREVHKFEVDTSPPRVAYRETISASAQGHHRHKKQTGGAGQFGEVFLRVEPLARGVGFEFLDQVKGGTIPHQFIPAVEKGVREVLESGALAGFPVVDVRVIVFDGKHHSVDSKEIAFATAGRKAFLDALLKARAIILEPIVSISITVPEYTMGDITGDLSARRGQVNGSDSGTTGFVVVKGSAPLAELTAYQSRLNAMTAGQGRYVISHSHYEAVPPAVQQRLCSSFKGHSDE